MTAAVTDFAQYGTLRAAANADANDPKVLREVAGQFEALFVQTLLKNMRASSLGEPLFGGSEQHNMYVEMLDKQLAVEMSSQRGFGLADVLVQQLGGEPAAPQSGSEESTDAPSMPVDRHDVSQDRHNVAVSQGETSQDRHKTSQDRHETSQDRHNVSGPVSLDRHALPRAISAPTAESSATLQPSDKPATEPDWHSPESFVAAIWDHAEKAAKRVGAATEAIVAQAALETGWGEHIMQRADGSTSFNLFGIKAGGGWQGDSVAKPTLEYRNGLAHREQAQFRAYDDLAAGFEDYVSFLESQARYSDALESGGSGARFASALQEAGYATDPEYARKIDRVIKSETMQRAMHELKLSSSQPINLEPGSDAGP